MAKDEIAYLREVAMPEVTLSAESLARVGIKLLNKYQVKLRCDGCGMIWRPVPCPEIRLPHGWWLCPRGCNGHHVADPVAGQETDGPKSPREGL
jgi:hypothetical protein